MHNEEEAQVDWEKEGTKKKIVDFFSSDSSQAVLEEQLRSYYELKEQLEKIEEAIKENREAILLSCRGMETAQAGDYIAMFKAVKGRETVDWKRLVSDEIGKVEPETMEKYTKRGEDSVRVEIRKVGLKGDAK